MIKTGVAMKKGRNWVWIMGIVSVLLLLETPLIHAWELKDFLSPFHLSVTVQEYNSNIFLTNSTQRT